MVCLYLKKWLRKSEAKVGDEIYFKESDTVRYNVKVSAITKIIVIIICI